MNQEVIVERIRAFNRCYTKVLGLLDRQFLESEFSLSEVRVLYELGIQSDCTAKNLAESLGLDTGYLSRMLKRFQTAGLIKKVPSQADGRSSLLELTAEGRVQLEELNRRSAQQIGTLFGELADNERQSLAGNMTEIEKLLTGQSQIRADEIQIRSDIRHGDAGMIIHMHGWIYALERGFGYAFEAYVAQSFYKYLTAYQEGRDRLWVVEHWGRIVGCIGVAAHGNAAQLRWFLLHPDYRGLGLGGRLLQEAVSFCRDSGYTSIYLDTTADQKKAIAMYERAGFVKKAEKENHMWAENVLEQTFELML